MKDIYSTVILKTINIKDNRQNGEPRMFYSMKHLKPKAGLQSVLRMLLLSTAVFSTEIWVGSAPFNSIAAYVDDDDDNDENDDDDDDDDDDNGPAAPVVNQTISGNNNAQPAQRSNKNDNSNNSDTNIVQKSKQNQPAQLPKHASNEIVLSGLSDDEIDNLASNGYVILQRDFIELAAVTIVRLKVPKGKLLQNAMAEIRAINTDANTDLNHFYRPGSTTSSKNPQPLMDCEGEHCAALQMIDWPHLPGESDSCGTGVRIGMIDTGINPDHEAFKGGRLEIIGAVDENRESSRHLHGSAVAAILLGSAQSRSPGLLPDAHLIAVDAFYRSTENDERSDVFTLIKAMDMLWEQEVSVINMSLTGGANKLLEEMMANLKADGIIVVAAVGNGGPNAELAYPAAYSGAIAVTAIDRHKNIYRRAAHGDHVDFAALGVDVWTATSISGARTKTGTSFAAPFVTAAVALIKNTQPDIHYDETVAILSASALDLGEEGKDTVFGHGLIQAGSLCD